MLKSLFYGVPMNNLENKLFRIHQEHTNVPILILNEGDVLEPSVTIKNGDISLFNFDAIIQYIMDSFNECSDPEDRYSKEDVMRSREMDALFEGGHLYFNHYMIEVVPDNVVQHYQEDIDSQNTQISINAWINYINLQKTNLHYGVFHKDTNEILEKSRFGKQMTPQMKQTLLNLNPKFLFREIEMTEQDFLKMYGTPISVNIRGTIYPSTIGYLALDDEYYPESKTNNPLSVYNKLGYFRDTERMSQFFEAFIKYD